MASYMEFGSIYELGLLTAHLATVVNSCAMKIFIYVEDIVGSTWVSDTPAQNFCKRNFHTPAWVDNVISLHGS
jgi:hypothetical protein